MQLHRSIHIGKRTKLFSPSYSSSQITNVEAEAVAFSRFRFRFHRKRTASNAFASSFRFRFHIPGAVPDTVWVGSKWLLIFPRVYVTPGTPLTQTVFSPFCLLNDRRRQLAASLKSRDCFLSSPAYLLPFFSFP